MVAPCLGAHSSVVVRPVVSASPVRRSLWSMLP